MTTPPQPGPWPPLGQPPVPPQGPPPGYYPQQPGWGGPPPPKQNNTIKWLLIGVGLLLVIAITVGVTVLVTNSGTDGDGPSTTTSASGPPIASADDKGPVEIITSEPTCQAWTPARDAMARVTNSGWGDRNPSIPATDWTTEQRAQYEAAGKAMGELADQSVEFARQTPHRVVRAMYEQFIYYARAYVDRLPNYEAKDNFLAQANLAASNALDAVCKAITYGSAAARLTSASSISVTNGSSTLGDPAKPKPIVSATSESCEKALKLHADLIAGSGDWSKYDPNIPAPEWMPDQLAASERTGQAFESFANGLEELASDGSNPTFDDIAAFGSVYSRAYAKALPTYEPADNYLFIVGTRASNLLGAACDAVRG